MDAGRRTLWPAHSRGLLLRACFLAGDDARQAAVAWQAAIDWQDHADMGSFRLLPTLSRRLQDEREDDPLLPRLRGIAKRNWVESRRFLEELKPLLGILRESAIDCMFLGGAALAFDCCPEYAFDFDRAVTLLVRPADGLQAIRQLSAAGWHSVPHLESNLMANYVAAHYTNSMRGGSRLRVELRWRLLPEDCDAAAEAWFWAAARALPLLESPLVLQLDAADHLLWLLAGYGHRDGEQRFERLVDALLRMHCGAPIDWKRFTDGVERFGLAEPVSLAAQALARDGVGLLPADVAAQLPALRRCQRRAIGYQLRTTGPLRAQRFWRLVFRCLHARPGRGPVAALRDFPRFLQYGWRLPKLRAIARAGLVKLREG
jgi:hypothetical protein